VVDVAHSQIAEVEGVREHVCRIPVRRAGRPGAFPDTHTGAFAARQQIVQTVVIDVRQRHAVVIARRWQSGAGVFPYPSVLRCQPGAHTAARAGSRKIDFVGVVDLPPGDGRPDAARGDYAGRDERPGIAAVPLPDMDAGSAGPGGEVSFTIVVEVGHRHAEGAVGWQWLHTLGPRAPTAGGAVVWPGRDDVGGRDQVGVAVAIQIGDGERTHAGCCLCDRSASPESREGRAIVLPALHLGEGRVHLRAGREVEVAVHIEIGDVEGIDGSQVFVADIVACPRSGKGVAVVLPGGEFVVLNRAAPGEDIQIAIGVHVGQKQGFDAVGGCEYDGLTPRAGKGRAVVFPRAHPVCGIAGDKIEVSVVVQVADSEGRSVGGRAAHVERRPCSGKGRVIVAPGHERRAVIAGDQIEVAVAVQVAGDQHKNGIGVACTVGDPGCVEGRAVVLPDLDFIPGRPRAARSDVQVSVVVEVARNEGVTGHSRRAERGERPRMGEGAAVIFPTVDLLPRRDQIDVAVVIQVTGSQGLDGTARLANAIATAKEKRCGTHWGGAQPGFVSPQPQHPD